MDGPFHFISSNIRFDNPSDGDHAWSHRRTGLAKILNSYNACIIATQEGRQPQLLDLAQLLPHHTLVDTHREWLEERMYPTLFVSKSIPVIESGDIWLSETPEVSGSLSFGSTFPRLCTWVRLKLNQQSLLVANVHLDHLQSETRLCQAQVLARQLLDRLTDDVMLVILGDFNEGPEVGVQQALLATLPFLHDPWVKLAVPEESSHHPFDQVERGGSRIDWILMDQRIAVETIFLDKTKVNDTWPSDHYPVICGFKL
jgi:endonuclease/exonuclease/phosphatase family metal-dependent hydrolase